MVQRNRTHFTEFQCRVKRFLCSAQIVCFTTPQGAVLDSRLLSAGNMMHHNTVAVTPFLLINIKP
jgi:hypothetical protein